MDVYVYEWLTVGEQREGSGPGQNIDEDTRYQLHTILHIYSICAQRLAKDAPLVTLMGISPGANACLTMLMLREMKNGVCLLGYELTTVAHSMLFLELDPYQWPSSHPPRDAIQKAYHSTEFRQTGQQCGKLRGGCSKVLSRGENPSSSLFKEEKRSRGGGGGGFHAHPCSKWFDCRRAAQFWEGQNLFPRVQMVKKGELSSPLHIC
jgi:hypothetical protein